MTDLETIKQACVKANPEIEVTCPFGGCIGCPHYRPCRLADVLLAMVKTKQYTFFKCDLWPDEAFSIGNDEFGRQFWNLREYDLTKRSPETLRFLVKLLK